MKAIWETGKVCSNLRSPHFVIWLILFYLSSTKYQRSENFISYLSQRYTNGIIFWIRLNDFFAKQNYFKYLIVFQLFCLKTLDIQLRFSSLQLDKIIITNIRLIWNVIYVISCMLIYYCITISIFRKTTFVFLNVPKWWT